MANLKGEVKMVKTMKKGLAVILALAVCISIICIPASAVGSKSTSANGLPYMLCNYENEIVNISGGEIVEGGMGGSGNALQLTTTSGQDHTLKNKWGSNFGATIPAGSTLRISFGVKFAEAVEGNATFALISYQIGGYAAECKVSSPAADEWYTVVMEKTLDEEKIMQAAWLRCSGFEQTILIDDFEASIVPADKADQIENMDNYYASYEGEVAPFAIFDSGYRNATTTERVVGAKTIQVVANPEGAGKVVKYTADTTVGAASTDLLISNSTSTGQYEGGKAPAGIVNPGETATIRFKYYLGTAISPDNNPGMSVLMKDINNVEHYFEGETIATTAGVWHTAVLTYTNDTEEAVEFGGKYTWLRLCKNYAAVSGSMKAAVITEGTNGDRVIYFDDMEMYITGAEEELPVLSELAKSSDFVINGAAVAGRLVSYAHSFTPATASEEGVTDASVVRIVNYTTTGEKAVIDYCGISENFIFPETPEDSERMAIEVVPVGSDGTVGEVVEYAIPAIPESISIARTIGGITVSTDEAITDAKLIFVKYADGKMAACDISTTVSLVAYAVREFAIPDGFANAKVFLWKDLTTLAPLTDALN